jgi:hypothetical protein
MPAFYDGGWSSMNMDDWQLDIDTPLKAIERIAQSEERMLAIQFFLFFSRFEYALKCLGKINPSFSLATGEPHETSGIVPKALQSLQAGISVFLVGKAAFQPMPSIW